LKCWRCHNQQKKFPKNLSYIIPVEQQNTRLINAILINKPYSKTVYFMTFQLGVLTWLSTEGLNSALADKYNNGKTGVVSKKSNMVI
jgi:hypothetical protein